MRLKKRSLISCLFVGVLAGVAVFTFRYAEGLSYLSNDPKACMNCHVMNEHYDSWTKSSHKAVAACNDCHTPHDLIPKYLTKAENGWNHSKAFTLQNFPEPIRITKSNLLKLQENCVRCHSSVIEDVVAHKSLEKNQFRCTECHAGVGHMSLS